MRCNTGEDEHANSSVRAQVGAHAALYFGESRASQRQQIPGYNSVERIGTLLQQYAHLQEWMQFDACPPPPAEAYRRPDQVRD